MRYDNRTSRNPPDDLPGRCRAGHLYQHEAIGSTSAVTEIIRIPERYVSGNPRPVPAGRTAGLPRIREPVEGL